MNATTMRRSILLLLAPLILGCGGAGRPTLFPASGRVQVGGKPAAGVLVRLHPLEASPDAATPHAATGADGGFVVESSGRPGALSGRYAVTLTWPPPPAFGPSGRATSDRLAGRYAVKDRAFTVITILPSGNDLGVLDVPEPGRSTTFGTVRSGNRP